jgi:hypothetical protein
MRSRDHHDHRDHRDHHDHRDDTGSTVPLIIGFALVILVLIAVVTDATAAYLDRQSLESLAEAAALQGADLGAQGREVYEGRAPGSRLELTGAAAQRSVTAYLRAAGAADRYPGVSPRVRVDQQARSVSVELCARVDLPLGVPGLARSATVCGSGQAAVTEDE